MPDAREALVAGFLLITVTLIVAIATVHDASICTQSSTAAIIQKFEVTVPVFINVLGTMVLAFFTSATKAHSPSATLNIAFPP